MLDVIIIGAGAAGLAAAKELQKNKVKFKVLEARGRVGGRVLTKLKNFPAELGPEFVHGEAKRVNAYLKEEGFSSIMIPESHHIFNDGKLMPLEIWSPIAETLKKMRGSIHDCSLAEGLKKVRQASANDIEATQAYFQGFDAVLVNQVSLKELLFSQGQVTDSEERGTCRVIKGYSALFSNISKPFESKILFHSIVKKVVWKKVKL